MPVMKIESDILKTAGVVVVLVGVFSGAVLWPSMRQNQVLAQELQGRRAELDRLRRPDLAPLREAISQLRAELRERSVTLPVGELHDRVLHHVSDTLLAEGVTLYETSYRESKAYRRFSMTPIDVDFDSRFASAFRVLHQIENQGPPVRVERLEMRGTPEEPSSVVEVNLQLSSFFLPDEPRGVTP